MNKLYLRKICYLMIIISCISLCYLLFDYRNKKENHFSLSLEQRQELNDKFIDSFNNDLFIETDELFKNDTFKEWKNNKKIENSKVLIDKVCYLGKEKIADLMIKSTNDEIDNDTLFFLSENFTNDKNIITSYEFDLYFDLNVIKHPGKKTNAFTLRLADEVINNSKILLISYRINDYININCTAIVVVDKSCILIPNPKYNKGDFIN